MGAIIALVAIIGAFSVPIVALLTKGNRSKSETNRILKDLESIKKENFQLKQRLENIETIVTEPDYDIHRTLKSSGDQNHKLLD
ncbi:hypothetical protein [Flammeovirga sp. OC4]|uniref:hypothetical protein n=1 Tax=Flammeovirga sp. OC4 TaxID=1382345 RepID=UPI0005C6DA8C|nr:hypothetical protein [Flammeovirga sp. OC4]